MVCNTINDIILAIQLFTISLIYKLGEKMASTWAINLAKKLLRNILKSIQISKEDIDKIVEYADKNDNGLLDGEEIFDLILEYRSIKK